MKDKCNISIINNVDSIVHTLSEFHKSIFAQTYLKGDLIYFDSNFPAYLAKIVEKSDTDKIFTLEIQNNLCGFIHLKIFNDSIFLNNIFVSKSFQGKGIGTYFLGQSLNFFKKEKFKYFALDVFFSNKKALRWYKKMGMKTVNQKEWYKIDGQSFTAGRNKAALDFHKDLNGFDCFYHETNKAGTVVNSTLIINDIRFIENLPLKQFKRVISNEKPDKESTQLKFRNIETSIRMQGNLNEVVAGLRL